MDLSKLTPAGSWNPENWDCVTLCWMQGKHGAADLAFVKIARLAFDVMMRRGWHAEKCVESGQWFIPKLVLHFHQPGSIEAAYADDPFTALVNADKWYRENVDVRD